MTISLSFRISPSFYTCPCGQSQILTQKLTALLTHFIIIIFITFLSWLPLISVSTGEHAAALSSLALCCPAPVIDN